MTTSDPVLVFVEQEVERLTTEIKAAEDNKEWLVGRHGLDGYSMHLKQDRTQLSAWLALKSAVERHQPEKYGAELLGLPDVCATCVALDRYGAVPFPCPEYTDIAEKLGVVL